MRKHEPVQLATPFPTCPAALSATQIEQFQRDGYLAFTGVLSPKEIADSGSTLTALVQRSVRSPGFTFEKHRNAQSKTSRFYVQFEQSQRGIDIHTQSDAELELHVRKLMWYCDASP